MSAVKRGCGKATALRGEKQIPSGNDNKTAIMTSKGKSRLVDAYVFVPDFGVLMDEAFEEFAALA
jgi:hypothetical protein